MPNFRRSALLPDARRAGRPLSARATSHTCAPWILALLWLGQASLTGCAPDSTSDKPPAAAGSPEDQSRIEELRRAFDPLPPSSTSDKQYAWSEAKRKLLLELEQGPPTLAPAALATFEQEPQAGDEWRTALLSIAARTRRDLAEPVLEKLTLEYDGRTSLGVRNEAMRLWCETAPAKAVKALEPILLQTRSKITYPPKEQMLRHWVKAARGIRQPVDGTLARVATDLEQAADTRYVAVEELSTEKQSVVGHKALETVLVESGSDGMLRRKAAQAMRTALPRDEMCAILKRVSERESDATFIHFLADMLDKNCP